MFGNQLVSDVNYIFIPSLCFLSQWQKNPCLHLDVLIVFHLRMRKELAVRYRYSQHDNKPVILMTQKQRIRRVSDTIWLRIYMTATRSIFCY